MELFREDGCLTDEGLQALIDGQLDELGRLEAAEHLSYCDRCMDRYTALLTGDVVKQPPRDLSRPVGRTILIRLMQNVYGRMAVAGVAAVLALAMWRTGSLQNVLGHNTPSLETYTPEQIAPASPELPPKSSYTEPPSPEEKTSSAAVFWAKKAAEKILKKFLKKWLTIAGTVCIILKVATRQRKRWPGSSVG